MHQYAVSNIFFLLFSLTGSMFFYIAAYVNISAVLISLYPHTISDGYYLLLLLTNKPNIRLNALKWIFSDKKTKPSTSILLFIIVYVTLTCTGFLTTFLYFRTTIQMICIYFSLNTVYVLLIFFVIYCFVIFFLSVRQQNIEQANTVYLIPYETKKYVYRITSHLDEKILQERILHIIQQNIKTIISYMT